jgi:ATP-dependent DNA ligase
MGEDDAPPIDPGLPLTFVAVDLLSIDDQPMLDIPLLERKRILETAFVEAELVRRSAFVRPPVGPWLISWRAFGFTEIAYKDANSRYTLGMPNPGWAVATIPIR